MMIKYVKVYSSGYDVIVDGTFVGRVSARKKPWKTHRVWVARNANNIEVGIELTRNDAAQLLTKSV